MSLVRSELSSKSISADVAGHLQRGWTTWNEAIEDFAAQDTSISLHRVRTKSKALRYAVELSLRLYPDRQLGRASNWLKKIQDQVGAWHDELMLGQRALETFAGSPRAPAQLKAVRQIKEKEIAMAEEARELVLSIRRSPEYRRMHRRLSASVFAMADGHQFQRAGNKTLTGPI